MASQINTIFTRIRTHFDWNIAYFLLYDVYSIYHYVVEWGNIPYNGTRL